MTAVLKAFPDCSSMTLFGKQFHSFIYCMCNKTVLVFVYFDTKLKEFFAMELPSGLFPYMFSTKELHSS